MANYINAKDYEDDAFKKGDELNARLVEAGKTCFALSKSLAPLYAQAQGDLARAGSAAKTPLRAAIGEDYEHARRIEVAITKGGGNVEEIA